MGLLEVPHIYYKDAVGNKIKFKLLLTEDSKSGYQFYQHYFKNSEIECVSTASNSAIFRYIKENPDKMIFVVADGAAFGSEIDRVLKLPGQNFRLCLPESFEWLILKSGLIRTEDIDMVLENPSEYRASLKTPFEKKQLCTTSASSTSLGVRQHACGRFPCSCHTYLFFL